MAMSRRLVGAGSRARLRVAGDAHLVAAIRRGDRDAFEALYDRHSRELLAFCIYMLGSRQDGEDALQATFASAYRALRADSRPVRLRPWLFTIARNESISVLRRRRETVELNGEVALSGDPVKLLEIAEDVRETVADILELPEEQRAALVLAEVHGLSQAEIASVLAVRPEQVKAFIYQARSHLISEREAREADCRAIREELATAHGAALLRGRLRRHLRSCAGCRAYAEGISRQHNRLGALLPFLPSLAVRHRALEEALGLSGVDPATYANGAAVGTSMAGAAVEVAGGGVKALALKLAAGVAVLGASAGVGVSVLDLPPEGQGSLRAAGANSGALVAQVVAGRGSSPGATGSLGASSVAGSESALPGGYGGGRRHRAGEGSASLSPGSSLQDVTTPLDGASPVSAGVEGAGGREPRQAGQTPHSEAELAQDSQEDLAARERRQAQQREREVHRQQRDAQRAEREAAAPKTQEERQQRHRERHEETHPVGFSRAPKSEEERERDRERHRLKHEEKLRREREEREREASG